MSPGFQANLRFLLLFATQVVAATIVGAVVSWFYPDNPKPALAAAFGALFLVPIVAMIWGDQVNRPDKRLWAAQVVAALAVGAGVGWFHPDNPKLVSVSMLGAVFSVLIVAMFWDGYLARLWFKRARLNTGDERLPRFERPGDGRPDHPK